MLQLARKLKVKKFVYAASSSCYGLASVPTKENHFLDPKYPYALSKLMGEQLCTHWSKVYNLPIISIRILMLMVLESEPPELTEQFLGCFSNKN